MTAHQELLSRFGIFAGFSDQELAEIYALCQEESYEDGKVLFAEGDTADRLFLILEGRVSLDKKVQLGRSGSARQATVSIVQPDQVAGWSSLIAPHNYTSSGVCLEPSRALVLKGQDVRRYISLNPAAGLPLMDAIASTISSRLRNSTTTLTYFLSIISHELKSPLAAVENYLHVMLGGYTGELNAKQRRMLERSVLRVADLRGLINDILDLARMRPEQIQADFEWLNPSEPGAQAIEDVRLAASQKDVELRVVAPAEFRRIVGARRRLRQLFSNLLSNAVKFSPQGGVVTLRARDEPERLVVEILDQGPGIPEEEQSLVFEDFFRGRNAGEVAGSGLGLSIASKIVQAHKGEIWVESPYEEGKSGSRFVVTIPRDLETPEMKRLSWSKRQEGP
jgi:signal transduction histidine kinase